jgi:hypothetical protein
MPATTNQAAPHFATSEHAAKEFEGVGPPPPLARPSSTRTTGRTRAAHHRR